MKIALYGGAFDPPHVCHLLAAAYVLATRSVDELWLVPTFTHPLGKITCQYEDRVAMCEQLVEELGPRAKVSRAEAELASGHGKTLFLLRHLRAQHPDDSFVLVIGADNYRDRKLWFGFDEIERLAEIAIVGRAGAPELPESIVLPDVSSTEIRRRLAAGEPVQHLMPRAVVEYVQRRGLYRSATP
jgi:nicotinate-nucleotide adenylyltransferase